ncbi:MAG: hypothetical protein IT370_23685 [Deltaproteobacteria bacterium]|nr:hypothetical protein [Deltaproteobacteria bacterium]
MSASGSRWCLLSLGLAVSVAAGCGGSPRKVEGLPTARAPSGPPAFPSTCARKGRATFVMGQSVDAISIEEVASHFRDVYHVDVDVLPSFPESVFEGVFDPVEKQVLVEAALRALVGHLGPIPTGTWLFAVTDLDLRIESRPDWGWAFAGRVGNASLISIERMREPVGEITPAQLHARIFKLIARQLGDVYCGLPRTGPDSSVMRREILSLDDLDAIDESDWRVKE